MTTVQLETFINAPIGRCFDLSRSVELHLLSTSSTKERAIAGKATGLMSLGDTVTWQAVHFGITQQLTVQITKMQEHNYFRDEQLQGAFKSMTHDHYFETEGTGSVMKDIFCYETPYGFAGRVFDALILKQHMSRFLRVRNHTIKTVAEKNEWQNIL